MNSGRPELSAHDWTDAGLKALEEEGYPAVRADRIAAALGVSRGSFYWHFADVGAFEAALIARWREIVLEALDPPMGPGETARDRFATIMRRSLLTSRRLETQFRAWGAVNQSVRAALDRVDANRESYFIRLLSDHPGRSEQAIRAVPGSHTGPIWGGCRLRLSVSRTSKTSSRCCSTC